MTPVKDGPIITAISNQEMSEDTNLPIVLSATDIDTSVENLTFSAEDLSGGGNIELVVDNDTDILTITPAQDYCCGSGGEECDATCPDIEVTVDDGEFEDSTTFTLTVLPVAGNTDIADIDPQTMLEDHIHELQATTQLLENMEDGAQFSWSHTEEPENFSGTIVGEINYDNHSSGNKYDLTITPTANWSGGPAIITVSTSIPDPYGGEDLTDSIDFSLTVTPVNDAPQIFDIDPQTIDEDDSLTITLSHSDVDDDDVFEPYPPPYEETEGTPE